MQDLAPFRLKVGREPVLGLQCPHRFSNGPRVTCGA
jgi:hypothetical protein